MGQKQSVMGGSKAPVDHNSTHSKREKTASMKGAATPGGGGAGVTTPAKQTPPHVVSTFDEYYIGKVSIFLSNAGVTAFSQTCRLFHQRSHPALSYRMRPDTQHLLGHVIRGEQDEAQKLLEKNPKLLILRSVETFDYSGRRFKGISAWQAALSAGDVEMLQMMEPYLDSIAVTKRDQNGALITINGREISEKQTCEMFSKDFDAHLSQQEASTFDFDAIVAAIDGANEAQLRSAIYLEGAVLPATEALLKPMTNGGDANELTEKLNTFRQAFTTQSLQEKVFNPQHLLHALKISEDKYPHWSRCQYRVFWSQVVGFAQRFMSTCYAQDFAQAFAFRTTNSKPHALERSLVFKYQPHPYDEQIFSADSSFLGFQGLGFQCAAPGDGWWGDSGHPERYLSTIFKSYVKQKQATLRTYARTRAADPVGTLVRLGR